MKDLNRTLTVKADDIPVTGFSHARLSGRETVGLYPDPFTLRLWNLPDAAYHLLASAKEISVCSGPSVLATGTLSDAWRRAVPEGTLTEAVFSPGLRLWEAPVSLSVEGGVTVSETIRRILAASGTGIPLLSFSGPDPVRIRGQAFFGRAAECVSSALSAAKARACLTPSGLCVIPLSGLPVSLYLAAPELTDAPAFAAGRRMILRTVPTGWPLGKAVSVTWQGETVTGLVTERCIDADDGDGPWEAQLLAETENSPGKAPGE